MKKLSSFFVATLLLIPLSVYGGGGTGIGGHGPTYGGDPAKPGTVSELKFDHTVETLNADRTILITDKPVLWFDCNGSDRNVTLCPMAANSTDLVFTIVNRSDGAGEDLVVKDGNATPVTLFTIGPEQGQRFSCDGANWEAWFDSGVYWDGVNGYVGVGTTAPEAPLHVISSANFNTGIFESAGAVVQELVLNTGHTGYGNARANALVFKEAGTFRAGLGVASSNTADIENKLSFIVGGAMSDTPEMVIQLNGNIGIGTTSPDTLLELQKEAADAEETISVYHDTEATAPIITLRKADNNATAPALVDDNAVLGRINFKGHDGSGWHTGAKIEARVDGTPSDGTDMPTELVFATTADGAGSPTDRVRIGPDGEVEITNRMALNDNTFSFTTEADITDPLPSAVILLSGDNDSEDDSIDLQDGETAGQLLYLIAHANIDADDTCTINMADTTCTNCCAIVFNKVGENAHLLWTGSTWAVISIQDAL